MHDAFNKPKEIRKKYDKIVIVNKLTCFSCYKNNAKILFIITDFQNADYVSKIAKEKSILMKFPNSTVVFSLKKYTNLKT